MPSPDVSVIIPAYNRAELLKVAVASCLKQEAVEVEVIVVDDGSTDQTAAAAQAFDGRVRYVRQENAGACVARNRGLNQARGRFLKFLDSDDYLAPDSLALQVRHLEASGADISYGLWEETGLEGPSGRPAPVMPEADPVDALLGGWWCANFAYLIKAGTARQASWDPELGSSQDFDYALQLALAGASFVHTPCLVGCYRWHRQERVSRGKTVAVLKSRLRVLDKAQTALARKNGLALKLRRHLADRYFELAQNAYRHDRPLFRELIAKVKNVSPGFRPKKRAHALLAALLGFELTESLLERRRLWKKI